MSNLQKAYGEPEKPDLTFTKEEFENANLEGFCRSCPEIYCEGWKKVALEGIIEGTTIVAWECLHYTII